MKKRDLRPDRVSYYFLNEIPALAVTTISGIIYNIGLAAVPWLDGKLVQKLCDILGGKARGSEMLVLAAIYLVTVFLVQGCRAVKRLYVRKFANRVSKRMRGVIYENILRKAMPGRDNSDIGNVMTKAVSDADSCAEGMRKFTTEVFDTGVAIVSYVVLLLSYDWWLAIICLVFTPLAYIIADKMKRVVTRYNGEYKECMGEVNSSTMERVTNALTYRVNGLETQRGEEYGSLLKTFEKKAVLADVWESAMHPLYKIVASAGTLFVIWFGSRNVVGIGWAAWDIAAFTTFLVCFQKLAVKSSRAAKLFNSVQKAKVSWGRVKDYLSKPEEITEGSLPAESCANELGMQDVTFAFSDSEPLFEGVNLTARPGDIIGVTGEVASGKSTFGRLLLGELSFSGAVTYRGESISELVAVNAPVVGYLGHSPELFHDTVENNICLGVPGDVSEVLRLVCLDEEVDSFPLKEKTMVGDGGIRLSGGQQARLSLARVLYHSRPLMVLDDPFSAVDRDTERKIFNNIRKYCSDRIIILISHRLELFPSLDKVVFLQNEEATVSDHSSLYETNSEYKRLCLLQRGKEGENE